ncbi:MAG: CotH kinase family protein [Armatimonadota bacterium]
MKRASGWRRRVPAAVLLLGISVGLLPLTAAPAQEKPPTDAAAPAKKPEAKPAAKPAPKPAASAPKPATPPKPAPRPDASVAFFRDGVVPRIKIQVSDADLNLLRQKPREYVRCTVVENDKTTYEHVAIKLKGAAGSFRGVDDRPALTLNFDKFKDGQAFHDLDKLHLNNSVQDPTYLNELISSELFLAAGVPAARTTHARVWLNGRDLGFYVLKEGFGKDFLKRNGLDPKGNLYEGPFVQDIDGNAELDSGAGVGDRSDVKAVVDACREGDTAKRWQRLEQLVDIDKFLTFMAMELMTAHWDGYCRNRNNYRFYFDPKTGKVQFFPHGMDQMFHDPNSDILGGHGAMLAQAVMSNPEWRGRYRDRVSDLMKLFVPPDNLLKRIDQHHQRLRPVLAEMGGNRANEFDGQVRTVKDRVTARAQSLTRQNAVVEPRPLRFSSSGVAQITTWAPRLETQDAKLEKQPGPAGKPNAGTLSIAAGPSGRCVASWRTKVILPAGKYRLEARARTQGVKALQEGSGTGAGLRISGGSRTNKLDGTADWTLLSHEIQIQAPQQEVELVAELRATAGQVLFDLASLRLVKVP